MATLRAAIRVSLFCTLALSLSRPITTAQGSSVGTRGTQNATQSNGLKLIVIAGDDAVNILQQRTAVAPVVEVRDRNDVPVAGATVRFAIRSGRALIGSGRALTVTTNAAGRATAVGFSPTGTGAVHVVASASFQGQTAAVAIAQTNVATAAQAAAITSSATTSGAGGAAAGGATTGGAIGGAATGGAAAGAGGAATGGLSGTAIGVIGGAAAGGAVVAAKVVNGNSESEASLDAGTTYSGQVALQLVMTFTGSCNVPVATIIYAESGLLTMQVITQSDGSVTGTAKWSGATQPTSDQCTLPNPGPNPFNRSWQITGSPTSLSFRSERTGTSTQTFPSGDSRTITQTDTYTFTGVLNAGVISGVFQHDEVSSSPAIPGGPAATAGSGSATTPVVLR